MESKQSGRQRKSTFLISKNTNLKAFSTKENGRKIRVKIKEDKK
jgi:hypothetical protein